MTLNDDDQPQGCLTKILGLVGLNWLIKPAVKTTLPYRLRDNFLSHAELSFYRVLKQAVPKELVIFCKVNLHDVFYVKQSEQSLNYRNKIDRKHVDFLLCDPKSMMPLLGVELDDVSHARKDRRERDQFVDEVFKAAGLPLLHIPAARGYSVFELSDLIQHNLKKTEVQTAEHKVQNGTPICPKCDTAMVLRTATKGTRKGQGFWGCRNYPQCRETLLLQE
tara:strand:+ start:49572 stop:50234 length:663 start_codon:yes stop_codon:yes gene_type:complete